MEQVLCALETIRIYHHGIGFSSKTWDHNMHLLDEILSWLKADGFIIY